MAITIFEEGEEGVEEGMHIHPARSAAEGMVDSREKDVRSRDAVRRVDRSVERGDGGFGIYTVISTSGRVSGEWSWPTCRATQFPAATAALRGERVEKRGLWSMFGAMYTTPTGTLRFGASSPLDTRYSSFSELTGSVPS